MVYLITESGYSITHAIIAYIKQINQNHYAILVYLFYSIHICAGIAHPRIINQEHSDDYDTKHYDYSSAQGRCCGNGRGRPGYGGRRCDETLGSQDTQTARRAR